MNITFLGTSAAWPLPRLGCDCQVCKSKDNKDFRLRSSIMVNDEILIDAPQDIYHQLNTLRIDPKSINYIIITHAHDDHIMGLHDLSRIYNQSGKPIIISTKTVIDKIKTKHKTSLLSFTTATINPLKKLKLGGKTDTWLIPVVHSVECYGIKIATTEKVLYAPEFRTIAESSKNHLKDLSLAILDGSSKTVDGQSRGHQSINEGIMLAKSLNPKKVLFTNMGHKTDRHKVLSDYVKKAGSDDYDIAFDGLTLKM